MEWCRHRNPVRATSRGTQRMHQIQRNASHNGRKLLSISGLVYQTYHCGKMLRDALFNSHTTATRRCTALQCGPFRRIARIWADIVFPSVRRRRRQPTTNATSRRVASPVSINYKPNANFCAKECARARAHTRTSASVRLCSTPYILLKHAYGAHGVFATTKNTSLPAGASA